MILSIANHKGGTGKTTCAVNLAAALAEIGKSVLVIDADPQSHATVSLGAQTGSETLALQHVLVDPGLPLDDALCPTNTPGVSLIPSTLDLAATEPVLAAAQNVKALRKRRPALRGYDFALIDCPPSIGYLTLNALVAADGLLLVVNCGGHAIRGLAGLIGLVQRLQVSSNPDLRILGVLINEFDRRTSVSSDMLATVEEYFHEVAFRTVIPRRADIERANNAGVPVLSHAPRSDGAQAYRSLALEVIERAEEDTAAKDCGLVAGSKSG